MKGLVVLKLYVYIWGSYGKEAVTYVWKILAKISGFVYIEMYLERLWVCVMMSHARSQSLCLPSLLSHLNVSSYCKTLDPAAEIWLFMAVYNRMNAADLRYSARVQASTEKVKALEKNSII